MGIVSYYIILLEYLHTQIPSVFSASFALTIMHCDIAITTVNKEQASASGSLVRNGVYWVRPPPNLSRISSILDSVTKFDIGYSIELHVAIQMTRAVSNIAIGLSNIIPNTVEMVLPLKYIKHPRETTLVLITI